MPIRRGEHTHAFTHGDCGNKSKGCWKCGKELSCCAVFCPCSVIQPIEKSCNYFEILKTPEAVDVNLDGLHGKFKDLQKRLHPDLYTNHSQLEKELSAENSALVNVAYQILKHPIERIKYLLVRQGIDVLEEGSPSSKAPVDPLFLMQVMETREQIDACKSVGALNDIRAQNRQQLEDLLDTIKVLHEKGEKDLLGKEAVKLQYFARVDEEVDQAITNLCSSCKASASSP